MAETKQVRVYKSDKERIDELTDDDRPWPARMQQLIELAERE